MLMRGFLGLISGLCETKISMLLDIEMSIFNFYQKLFLKK